MVLIFPPQCEVTMLEAHNAEESLEIEDCPAVTSSYLHLHLIIAGEIVGLVALGIIELFSHLSIRSLLLGVMFYRDWKVYKTTRKLPLLASYVPTWVPAFPFNLMGSEKKSKTSRKISNISSFSFLSNSSQNSGRSSSG